MNLDGPPAYVRSNSHIFRPNKEVVNTQIVAMRNIALLKMA